jgi:hypothetical protein
MRVVPQFEYRPALRIATPVNSHRFGTLKIAKRLLPKLIVSINEPANMCFFPVVLTKRHPVPLINFAPLGAFLV